MCLVDRVLEEGGWGGIEICGMMGCGWILCGVGFSAGLGCYEEMVVEERGFKRGKGRWFVDMVRLWWIQ